jgi:hypothetical protein
MATSAKKRPVSQDGEKGIQLRKMVVAMGRLGKLIGLKFREDGSACPYPGNTVITDLVSGNPAFCVMLHMRSKLIALGLSEWYIVLPEDSYHMTVIRGVNDKVREEAFWPKSIPLDAPMKEVDEYIARCVSDVPPLDTMEMRFSHLQINEEDVRVILKPGNLEQEQLLRQYRDKVADRIGLRLPGHEQYGFHITLAYTRVVPEGREQEQVEQYRQEMDEFLKQQPPFVLPAPYMAYYNDMLHFSDIPLPRTESDRK